MTMDVAIIGGGIAGLSAAYEFQRHGIAAQVFEAGPRPGGVILTERFDGWVIDAGPDSLLVQKPAAVSLCRELGIADRLVSTLTPRTAYVMRDGRLHPLAEGSFLGFPLKFSALARSPLFSIAGKVRVACEMFVPSGVGRDPRSGSGEDESIASFVRRRFGEEAVDYLADPLLAGIHAGDAERLSVRALFPRLIEAERQAGSVLRAFRALRVKPSPQGAFVSLPGGTGELIDALAAALASGIVALNARVTSVERTARGWRVTAGGAALNADAAGPDLARSSFEARALVFATPAYVTGALLRAHDTSLAALCEAVPYASTATVAFGYRADQVAHPMRGSGFVVPRVERRALLAGTWVTSKWPGRAPEGHVLLRGFLGGGRDPQRLESSDAELIDIARRELSALLGITGDPLFARLFRWTRQSPQYEVGHLQRVAAIDQRLAALPGVFVTGSGFRAIGIPDCIADGRATAGRAAAFVGRGSR
jgi:protoporphyrinogen/coproporphyrinogen III oxidase